MANRSGQILGNYKLLTLLGEGGFAQVYEAEHAYLGRHDAIKVMKTSVVENEAELFLKEARTIASLQHEHIVRIMDCSIDPQEKTPFLVMEYAPKGSLRKNCPRGLSLPYITVLSYIKQVASALQYAHDKQNLVHRDVKPENMLIKVDDTIVLSDFGIAVVEQTGPQTLMGSLIYMAPEQLQGRPLRASDQYALAVVAYEWLSGNPPFTGTMQELMIQHMTAVPPKLDGIVPPRVEAVIMRALEKDPRQRFPQVLDFATALESAYDDYTRISPEPTVSLSQPSMALSLPSFADPGAETVMNSGVFSQPVASAVERASRYTSLIKVFRQIDREYQKTKQECDNQFQKETSDFEKKLKQDQNDIQEQTKLFDQAINHMRDMLHRTKWDRSLSQLAPLLSQKAASLELLTEAQEKAISGSHDIVARLNTYTDHRNVYFRVLRISLPITALLYLLLALLHQSLWVWLFALASLLSLVVIFLWVRDYLQTKEKLGITYTDVQQESFIVKNMLPVQHEALANSRRQGLSDIQNRHAQASAEIEQRLQEKQAPHRVALDRYQQVDDFLVADWNAPLWSQWQADQPTTIALTRLGTIEENEKIPPVPALMICPGQDNLLIKVPASARRKAIHALQSLLLRLLITMPSGKLRLTLIDSVGMGENLAAFLHLADYDKQLVSGKVWTRKEQIEQQLTELSDHMENVIQQFLRDQYRTIDEYNREAGEIAEPYRILVIAGFPTNFTPTMARHLINIATTGPRCGVYVLMIVDTEHTSPARDGLTELERVSQVIFWEGQQFAWAHRELGPCRLQLDPQPSPTLFNQLLKNIGEKTLEARQRIEIPFRTIISARGIPQYSWWSENNSTVDEFSIPLGRLGATRYQYLRLGAGTAHHVLIVGTTGSGKTNLLHVLITGLALKYRPQELEFYLIDFKTVGFTPYASHKLPHARVVAIQSERAFGLSVLEGLQHELEERKRLFSQAHVQDFPQYRKLHPQARMPRILLIIDEFQELFLRQDGTAQAAAEYLDRFVRTGRGLGIHVLLASQTMAALSSSGHKTILDSSTISQMTVRIAMRNEKGDSRIILSEDNTSLEYLFQLRPGEAIYNADSGAEPGNNRFQSFWLPGTDLSIYLDSARHLAESHNYSPLHIQRIFDGSKNAEITRNSELQDLLKTDEYPVSQGPQVWLGEPISLKGPTCVQFYPRPGYNMLLLGREETVPTGLLTLAFFMLAAQHAPDSACFFLIDERASDRATELLHARERELPHKTENIGEEGLAPLFTRISEELQRRRQSRSNSEPVWYLLIPGLHRLRALHTGDRGPSDLGRQLAAIIRDGPEQGIHTLTWCNTLHSFARALNMPTLQDFNLRVALQMPESESRQFIEAPDANQLGSHRALLYRQDEEASEKFVAYEPPSAEWLLQTVQALRKKRTACDPLPL